MKYKPIILIASLMLAPQALASEETKIFVGGWSKHLNNKDLNETHNVVGFSYNNFELLKFNNSYNKSSTQISYHHKFNSYLGLRLGVVNGYNNKKYSVGEFIPVIHPTLSLDLHKVKGYSLGVEFGYVPYSGGDSKGVMTLQTYFKY